MWSLMERVGTEVTLEPRPRTTGWKEVPFSLVDAEGWGARFDGRTVL